MATLTQALARDVLEDVRTACEKTGRPTTLAEVIRALEALDGGEVDRLHKAALAGFDAAPLSPDALVDIVRGVAPAIAAARELGGYYALKAERDALAQIASARPAAPASPQPFALPVEQRIEADEEPVADEDADEAPEPRDEEAPTPPEAIAGEKPARRKAKAAPTDAEKAEIQRLVTLFAYHRDAVRVAQELKVGIVELNERIEALGLRRRIHRLLEQTTDIDLFSPESLGVPRAAGSPAPVVRRRAEKVERPAYPAGEPEIPAEEHRPAAQTAPVNAHGTRVYRRQPAATAPPTTAPAAAPGLAGRREYVRESRRQRQKAAQKGREPAPPPAPPPPPPRRPFAELQSTIGATVLERLLADEKANPRVLAQKLGERYAGPADRPLAESDLRALLQHHGLGQLFTDREIANTRFLIGFHQGARAKLAHALHLEAGELGAYLQRLGLDAELERTRTERSRIELGRRRVNDRIAQVLTRAPYLDDLGVLPVIDREVREHLDELFKRHGEDRSPAARESVRTELGLEPNAFNKLLRRYELA